MAHLDITLLQAEIAIITLATAMLEVTTFAGMIGVAVANGMLTIFAQAADRFIGYQPSESTVATALETGMCLTASRAATDVAMIGVLIETAVVAKTNFQILKRDLPEQGSF